MSAELIPLTIPRELTALVGNMLFDWLAVGHVLDHNPAHASGVIDIREQRRSVLIFYEQLRTWRVLVPWCSGPRFLMSSARRWYADAGLSGGFHWDGILESATCVLVRLCRRVILKRLGWYVIENKSHKDDLL